jgi:hypothetical protein
MSNGRPIPIVVYGSADNWKAGAIIVAQNHWYFREIKFHCDGDEVDDRYGLTYHRVHLVDTEICLGVVHGDFTCHLGEQQLAFWDYGIVLPDLINDVTEYRYGIIRSNWQYLDKDQRWSEHD